MGNLVNGGWVRLWRELLSKSIWTCSSPEHTKILITLLLLANHEKNEWVWRGERYVCEPGQLITSAKSIMEACGEGVTRQNVRTALKKFEKYGFLTIQSTKCGTLITIVNWGKYQGRDGEANQPSNQQVTKHQPTGNQQVTTNKNDKNIKNERMEEDNHILSGKPDGKLILLPAVREIVGYLNKKTGAKYRPSSRSTADKIKARLNDGFTVEDFKRVIDVKTAEWKGTDMEKFLRPETLFGTKFEGYLNQPEQKKQIKPDQNPDQRKGYKDELHFNV